MAPTTQVQMETHFAIIGRFFGLSYSASLERSTNFTQILMRLVRSLMRLSPVLESVRR